MDTCGVEIEAHVCYCERMREVVNTGRATARSAVQFRGLPGPLASCEGGWDDPRGGA